MSLFSCPTHRWFLFALLLTASAFSETIVELSSEASRSAVNDLIRTTVAAEATGTTPGELSRDVNRLIANALKTAKAYPGVKTRSSGTTTYPIYSAQGGKIESWRMRSELTLEATDGAALSELLGELQASLIVSSLVMQPSPDTRKSAENAATTDALAAFKARAQLIADALGQHYTIKQIAVSSSGRAPPVTPMLRSAAVHSADTMSMPIEAGESRVTVSVAGQIAVGN